jgi:hypothetical protein
MFILHQHENSIDRKLHQLIKTQIDIFGKYSETLEDLENFGIQGNSSKDLSDLELEIKDYEDKFGTQKYVHWASIIGGVSTIGIIFLFVALIYGCYRSNGSRKNSKKINELNKKTKENNGL